MQKIKNNLKLNRSTKYLCKLCWIIRFSENQILIGDTVGEMT